MRSMRRSCKLSSRASARRTESCGRRWVPWLGVCADTKLNLNFISRPQRPACQSTLFHAWETFLQEVEADSQSTSELSNLLSKQVSYFAHCVCVCINLQFNGLLLWPKLELSLMHRWRVVSWIELILICQLVQLNWGIVIKYEVAECCKVHNN